MISPEVVVYGTVCLDRFFLAGPNSSDDIELPGGEAFNTATALAGWEIPVALTGTAIGPEPEGIQLRALLQTHPLAQGLDSSLVPSLPDAVTPVCTVRVDASGERSMNGRGFQQAIAPPLEPLLPLFSQRPILAIDPNLGTAAVTAAQAAARAGCTIVAMDLADSPEVLAISHIAVTSQEWIARSKRDADAEAAVRRMASAGAEVAIVTLGAEGGIVCVRDSDTLWRYSAIVPPAPILDTTGAGDIFRAGLCYGLLIARRYGLSMDDSIRQTVCLAAAAAALHCTHVGGGSRVPLAEVVRLAATAPDGVI